MVSTWMEFGWLLGSGKPYSKHRDVALLWREVLKMQASLHIGLKPGFFPFLFRWLPPLVELWFTYMVSITVVSKHLPCQLKIDITRAGCLLWGEKCLVPVVVPALPAGCTLSALVLLSALLDAHNNHNQGYSDREKLLYKHREIGLLSQQIVIAVRVSPARKR